MRAEPKCEKEPEQEDNTAPEGTSEKTAGEAQNDSGNITGLELEPMYASNSGMEAIAYAREFQREQLPSRDQLRYRTAELTNKLRADMNRQIIELQQTGKTVWENHKNKHQATWEQGQEITTTEEWRRAIP